MSTVATRQRLLRDQLMTLDGETVRVLHPGFKNHEAGPDFRGAVVQIGSVSDIAKAVPGNFKPVSIAPAPKENEAEAVAGD